MTMSRRRFVGAAAVGAAFPFARTVPIDAATWLPRRWGLSDDFRASFEGRLADSDVLAASVAVGSESGAFDALSAGSLSVDRPSSVRDDSVFAAASLSKPVVATIAIRLHRQGVFDLDRPLATMLDDDVPTGPGADRLTARHALQHTSGLANWRFTLDTPFTTSREPGTAWGYSGEGVVLVQRALEVIGGMGIEGLAQEHVFEPYAMTSSSFLLRPEFEGRRAHPHAPGNRFLEYVALAEWKQRAVGEWADTQGRTLESVTIDDVRHADAVISGIAADLAGRALPETAPVPNFLNPNGAGGLLTTASDYARFLRGWLRDSAMLTVALDAPVDRPGGLQWGLGWGLEARDAPTSFWHWGETVGVRTLAYARPSESGGDFLAVLTTGERGMEICEAAFIDAIGDRSAIFDVV